MFKSGPVRTAPNKVFPRSQRGSSVENVIVYKSQIGGYVTFTLGLSTHKAPQFGANQILSWRKSPTDSCSHTQEVQLLCIAPDDHGK